MPNLLCVSHEWSLSLKDVRELSDAGFYLIPAANGLEAIKQFATRTIDAVVVNRRLPDIPVEDLTAYFRNHSAEMPVVMISSAMPVPETPTTVDAVIHQHSSHDLLAPTLLTLLKDVRESDEAESIAA